MGCLALVLATRAAWADGGASAGDDLKACKGLPAHAKAEVISDDAVYVAGRFLAFPHQEGGGCEVYAVARPGGPGRRPFRQRQQGVRGEGVAVLGG